MIKSQSERVPEFLRYLDSKYEMMPVASQQAMLHRSNASRAWRKVNVAGDPDLIWVEYCKPSAQKD
jgi:hypothetical protein